MNLVNRYKDNPTRKNNTGKTVYRSILYPIIEKSFTDIYITPNISDRLDFLAHKYYGDVRLWWIIAQANFLGKGSMNIPPNTRLRIPKDIPKILADYNNLNRNR